MALFVIYSMFLVLSHFPDIYLIKSFARCGKEKNPRPIDLGENRSTDGFEPLLTKNESEKTLVRES